MQLFRTESGGENTHVNMQGDFWAAELYIPKSEFSKGCEVNNSSYCKCTEPCFYISTVRYHSQNLGPGIPYLLVRVAITEAPAAFPAELCICV